MMRRRNRRGQALVEFALVLPILLMLVLGLVDFARAWNIFQVITDAAREGARTAVIDDPTITEDSVRVVVGGALARAALNPDDAVIEITGFKTGRGTPASVKIEYDYQLALIGAFMAFVSGDDQLTLTSQIVMRNE